MISKLTVDYYLTVDKKGKLKQLRWISHRLTELNFRIDQEIHFKVDWSDELNVYFNHFDRIDLFSTAILQTHIMLDAVMRWSLIDETFYSNHWSFEIQNPSHSILCHLIPSKPIQLNGIELN
jgi:hypothetical protein